MLVTRRSDSMSMASALLKEVSADAPPFEQVLHLADQACYDAKRSGSHLKIVRPADTSPGNPG